MKPLFTDNPEAWTRATRYSQSQAEYAGVITTPRNRVIGYDMKKNVIPLKPSIWARLLRWIRSKT